MTISKVELLDENGTYLQDITGWLEGSRMWSDPRRGFGNGAIAVNYDDTDEPALTARRFIRYTLDNDPDGTFAWMLQRRNVTRITTRGESRKVVHWSGDGALSYLGTEEYGHAIVVGEGDTGKRPFGWIAKDFDRSSWTSPAPHSGGHYAAPRVSSWEGLPDRWPDDRSEWLFTENSNTPTADGWFAHDLDVHGAQTATLFLSGVATAYFNGEAVAEVGSRKQYTRTTVELTGDDLLAVKAKGMAMWVIGVEDADGELQVLYRSTTGAPFDVSQSEIQHVSVDPESPPFPWGSDYPSTGPDNLQGTWTLTVPNYGETAAMQWDNDDTDTQSKLNAIAGLSGITVTGSNTPADPYVVTFPSSLGDVGTMQLDHSDLRHDHGDTWVRTIQQGKTQSVATGGANKISFTDTQPTGVTYGYVMSRLIDEAKARGCLSGVSYNFTDTLDTDGNAWAVSLPIYFARDGDQLGDLCVALTQDFDADCRMSPSLELLLYNTLGTDVSATVQLVDEADVTDPEDNAVSEAEVDEQAIRATAARVETDGGFGWAIDTAREATWGRLETKVAYGLASTVEEVEQAALSTLDDSAHLKRQPIQSHGPTGARPYTDYSPGYRVGAREEAGGSFVSVRVEEIGVNDLPADEVDFDVIVERR